MIINGFVPSDAVFQNNFGVEKSKNDNVSIGSFADTLKTSLDSVNSKQVASENLTSSFIKGDDVDVADVMLTSEEAKISLQYAVQVRNKLVDAYQEIIRMQL